MLKLKCFIIGMVLSLSLPANGIAYCSPPPLWAIARRRKLDEERREREQGEFNVRIKQGNMVNNENQKMTLSEAVALAAFASFVALSTLFRLTFFRQGKNTLKEDYEKQKDG